MKYFSLHSICFVVCEWEIVTVTVLYLHAGSICVCWCDLMSFFISMPRCWYWNGSLITIQTAGAVWVCVFVTVCVCVMLTAELLFNYHLNCESWVDHLKTEELHPAKWGKRLYYRHTTHNRHKHDKNPQTTRLLRSNEWLILLWRVAMSDKKDFCKKVYNDMCFLCACAFLGLFALRTYATICEGTAVSHPVLDAGVQSVNN